MGLAQNLTDCVLLLMYSIWRIMDEYEQDLRVLEEKHQQGNLWYWTPVTT